MFHAPLAATLLFPLWSRSNGTNWRHNAALERRKVSAATASQLRLLLPASSLLIVFSFVSIPVGWFNNASASCSCILNLFFACQSFHSSILYKYPTSSLCYIGQSITQVGIMFSLFLFPLSLSLSLSLFSYGSWSFYSLSLLFLSHPLDSFLIP